MATAHQRRTAMSRWRKNTPNVEEDGVVREHPAGRNQAVLRVRAERQFAHHVLRCDGQRHQQPPRRMAERPAPA